ncbi:hypothetical protein [Pseudomonas grimontii]|uniref:hypothetical protein n=1 Tax=Pseudomonas grimontii TaxID=129847 RepID=UPI00387B2AE1
MDFPKSVPSVGLVDGKFIDENAVAGTPGSLIPSAWGNAVTQEILKVIQEAGLEPDEDDNTQLNAAIDRKISESSVTFASQSEAEAGESDNKVMSPLRVAQAIDAAVVSSTEAASGIIKIATQAQTDAAASDGVAVTPKKLAAWFTSKAQATESVSGVAKISTPAQLSAGVDDATIITPKKLFNVDPWALQPIGVPIPVLAHLGGSLAPPTDKSYRYIKLTASDSYNSGVLTSEVVSGSEPLLQATAVISLAGSPLNGKTVSLINTERRVLRASEVSGELLSDALQGHFHAQAVGEDGVNGNTPNTITTYDAGQTSGNVGMRRTNGPGLNLITIRGAITDSSNGAVRVSGETRAKSISATYYLRIK